jgi:uncharacterized protein (DUF433 family)
MGGKVLYYFRVIVLYFLQLVIEAQIMAELSFDIQAVFQRLDALEKDICQLRDMLRPRMPTMSPPSDHPYIESIPTILSGETVIRGTRTPVRAIAEHWKFGDTAEEIAGKLPHLRLAQIFDALGYYDDHREEIERHIALNRVPVDD